MKALSEETIIWLTFFVVFSFGTSMEESTGSKSFESLLVLKARKMSLLSSDRI